MPIRSPDRVKIADLPTPLIQAERLGASFNNANIWIKRDDRTGLELSGNKIRKLEYVFAAAQAAGADTVVTEGAGQSNHCRATAAAAAQLGMRAHLLLAPPPKNVQGNVMLLELFGATYETFEREDFFARHDEILAATKQRLRDEGHVPHYAARGASEPIGCWGYIRAAAELAIQLDAAELLPCDLVVATSSGGTLAGLILGQKLHRIDGMRVTGVPVSDDEETNVGKIMQLCQDTIRQFDMPITVDEKDINLLHGYAGEGYGMPYDAEIDAIQLMARTEGLVLDPVYSGKSFYAVLDGLKAGRFGRERPVIYIHTGGFFSNFAWPDVILPGRA